MKNKTNIIIGILILLSGLLTFRLYNSLVKNPASTFALNKEIKNIEAENISLDNKITENKDILSQKKIEEESLTKELNNFDLIGQKEKLDELTKNIKDLELENIYGDLRLNRSFITNTKDSKNPEDNKESSLGESPLKESQLENALANKEETNSFKALDSIYFKDSLTNDEIKNNINFLPLVLEYAFNNDLNLKIARHNADVIEYYGVIDYLENGDNFLIKSKVLKYNTDLNKTKESAYNILSEEDKFLLLFKDLGIINYEENLSSYTEDLANKELSLMSEGGSENKDLNDINQYGIYAYETLNKGVNFINFLKIREDKDNRYLENLEGRIFIKESKREDKKILEYYDGSGEIFYTSEFTSE